MKEATLIKQRKDLLVKHEQLKREYNTAKKALKRHEDAMGAWDRFIITNH